MTTARHAPISNGRWPTFPDPSFAQDKLIHVVHERVLDMAIDICKAFPARYRRVVGREPIGFAHGFCTLAPDTKIYYEVSARHNLQHDAGIFWSDPEFAISWPVDSESAVISERDKLLPRFRDMVSPI